MRITPTQKIASVLGAGSLLVGAVALAPGAAAGLTGSAEPAAVAAAPAAAERPALAGPMAAVPASAPLAAGPRTALVTAWYQQFLGRSPDAGAQYWIVRLRTEAPATVLADLLRTPEHVGARIGGYYQDYLGRSIEGDPSADYWFSGVYDQRFPLEWVEQNVLGSSEYQAVVAADDPQRGPQLVVAQWYRDVLGREASASEVGYWSIQFEDQSNLSILRRIWYSPEAVQQRIVAHYEEYLQRSASPGEIAYWYDAEVASDAAVVLAVASSAEYRANAPTFLP